jgi:DNA-binding SARP family transcriptional activator
MLLRALEADGLFVIHSAGVYRPLRALSRLHSHARLTPEVHNVRPMHIRMLGRFQAEIDGTPIEWIRRRDAQIFQFVALKRNGTASRAELAETFWPGAEKHLVAQSLRTAFSNIRKAIGTIVGFDLIDAYVHANGDLSLNLGNVIVDVNRFIAHANDGDVQYARDELRAAFAHYRSADYAYWGDLLISDAAQPRFAAQAAMLSDRHLLILERLTEITRELKNYGASVHYARRVVELRPGNQAAAEALAESMRLARLHKITVVAPAPDQAPSSIGATSFA